MKRPDIYVAAKRWTYSMMDALQSTATGVILGDHFCQKRMFENEWYDLLDMAQYSKEMGFQLVFQTPVYNTTRVMESTIALLRKLHELGLLDAVFVHDVGVLESIESWGVDLWWDRYSFNRDIEPNAYLVDFLMQHSVSKIEIIRPSDIMDIINQRCGVLVHGYGPQVVSFGRICYTEYFLNEPCERKILCNDNKPFIASVDKVPLHYTADGFTLVDKSNPLHTVVDIGPKLFERIDGITTLLSDETEINSLNAYISNIGTAQTTESL